jgi:hypothetical protein
MYIISQVEFLRKEWHKSINFIFHFICPLAQKTQLHKVYEVYNRGEPTEKLHTEKSIVLQVKIIYKIYFALQSSSEPCLWQAPDYPYCLVPNGP